MKEIKVIRGDITKLKISAIVNAANNSLLGGGGVDGVIHRVAGAGLLEECKRLNGCATGDAKITGGYGLLADYVIHTVGPVWHGGRYGEAQKLVSAYRRSLEVAVENNISEIAFPNISTGVYGYPKRAAAEIAITTVKDFLFENRRIKTIVFVTFDSDNYNIYNDILAGVELESVCL